MLGVTNKLSVLKIVGNTAADGPGLRTSVYLAGCGHCCPGCHNPQSWDIGNGVNLTIEDIVREIESYGNKKVTITGGDPFYQPYGLLDLLKELKKRKYHVWVYTGYTLEALQDTTNSSPWGQSIQLCLHYLDGLVDGPYMQSLRDTSLRFRGSSNQKIYTRDSQGDLRVDLSYNSI